MKKAINQKLENPSLTTNYLIEKPFVVVITKGKKTYKFYYELRDVAHEQFKKFMIEEADFCQLMGRKSIVGLWEFLCGEKICRRQIVMNGLY